MKIKTLKKLNTALFVVLCCCFVGAGILLGIAQNRLGVFAGKADNILDLDKKGKIEQVEHEKKLEGDVFVTDSAEKTIGYENKNEKDIGNRQVDQKAEIENPKFSFVAIGDSDSKKEQTGFSSNLDFVLGKSKDYLPDFVLFTGDVLRTGIENKDQSKTRIEALKILVQKHFNKHYFVFGNHDIECGNDCIGFWEQIFFGANEKEAKKDRQLYHSFDFKNTHFVLLSTDYPKRRTIDEQQFKWLEEDLSKNKLANIIVSQHIPPVPFFEDSQKQCRDMTCDEPARVKLLSLFKKHGVDLVLSGNENAFDHRVVDGIDFVLSGSVGNESEHKGIIKGDMYVLCSVDGEKISVEAMNTRGQVIKKIEIK